MLDDIALGLEQRGTDGAAGQAADNADQHRVGTGHLQRLYPTHQQLLRGEKGAEADGCADGDGVDQVATLHGVAPDFEQFGFHLDSPTALAGFYCYEREEIALIALCPGYVWRAGHGLPWMPLAGRVRH
ncbi:hypothetical protein D3C81_555320 [compost metagenome]